MSMTGYAYQLFKKLPKTLRKKLVHPFVIFSRRHGKYHLISFPKCGRTWLRMMIGYCLVHHFNLPVRRYLEIDLLGFMSLGAPIVGVSHDGLPQFRTPPELDRSKSDYRNQKILFLARDPRDVIVSNYFQQTKRRETFEGSLPAFVRRERGGLRTLLEFYRVWFQERQTPEDFLLVRYEDLHDSVGEQLDRVLEYLGLDEIPDSIRREAIEEAAFENMKERERDPEEDNFRLQPGDRDDPESYKVRKGKVGGYEQYLDRETVSYVEEHMAETLPAFYGYRPNCG